MAARRSLIISISYGQCETVNGAAANAAYNSTYQQAVAEGVSVSLLLVIAARLVATIALRKHSRHRRQRLRFHALQRRRRRHRFQRHLLRHERTYWNSATRRLRFAISYIPEIPWNAPALAHSSRLTWVTAQRTAQRVFAMTALRLLLKTTVAGVVAQRMRNRDPSAGDVVSALARDAETSWQKRARNPADGVRDTPDVSLFAADGLWSHYYVFCWSDTAHVELPAAPSECLSGAGGTSFAAPIMAGIQALINQKAGGPQGNPPQFITS